MTDDHEEYESLPSAQHLPAHSVINELAEFGRNRIENLSIFKVLVLAIMGGAFITAGALFSVLLASGFESYGARFSWKGLDSRRDSSSSCCRKLYFLQRRTSQCQQRCSAVYRQPVVCSGSGASRSWET